MMTKWVIKSQWKEVEQIECYVFCEKSYFYCQKQKLQPSHSDDSSSELQDNKINIVTDSEDERSADHY